MASKQTPLKLEDSGPYQELRSRPNPSRLAIVFSPALCVVLIRAEREKSAELTGDELNRIRDNAPAIAVTRRQVKLLEESRGYKDVAPRNLAASWRAFKQQT